MSTRKGRPVVPEWLRDGIEGRSLKATLRLYLFGLMVLAPAAVCIGYLFGAQASFQVTPVLVLILVGVEYGLCYPEKILRIIPGRRPNLRLLPNVVLQGGGLTPKVKVIGIGGAGGNAINAMIQAHMTGVEFIAVNTDISALNSSLAPLKLPLGSRLTKGLGAGANPEISRQAAWQDVGKIAEMVDGAHVVFIIAGMGGGTGTGTAPVMARVAREKGILTVAVVTRPFAFEGRKRMGQAEAAIHELREHVDALILISDQLLLQGVDTRTPLPLRDIFKVVDDVIRQAVQGIADLFTVSGAFDFADFRTFVSRMGVGCLGIGVARGEKRVEAATRQALSHPLLEESAIAKARCVLINVTGGPDLSLAEVHKAAAVVHEVVHEDASIVFGSVIDPNIKDEVRVTIIAADFDTGANSPSSKQMPLSGKRIVLKYTTRTLPDRTVKSPVDGAIGESP